MTTQKTYTLDELCALTQLNKRTIRFYMQQGLLPNAHGEKRGSWYDEDHLQRLLTIIAWKDKGVSLERIAGILNGIDSQDHLPPRRVGGIEVWSRILLAEGVELSINAEQAQLSPAQLRAFQSACMDLLKDMQQQELP